MVELNLFSPNPFKIDFEEKPRLNTALLIVRSLIFSCNRLFLCYNNLRAAAKAVEGGGRRLQNSVLFSENIDQSEAATVILWEVRLWGLQISPYSS